MRIRSLFSHVPGVRVDRLWRDGDVASEDYVATREELRHRAAATFAGVREGRYPVTIGGTFPLAAVADADRALADRGRTGKLILVPQPCEGSGESAIGIA